MVRGMDWFRRSLVSRFAKIARICSKCSATSRPLFKPASVTTMKWAESISTQGVGSAARATRVSDKIRVSNAARDGMESRRSMEPGGETAFIEMLSREMQARRRSVSHFGRDCDRRYGLGWVKAAIMPTLCLYPGILLLSFCTYWRCYLRSRTQEQPLPRPAQGL